MSGKSEVFVALSYGSEPVARTVVRKGDKYWLTDRHEIIARDGDSGWYMVEDDCPIDDPDAFSSRCDFLDEEMRIMMAEFA